MLLAHTLGMVPMETVIKTTWTGNEFQTFSTFVWVAALLIIGALLPQKVKGDNFILTLILIFGVGSAVIHTAVGAAIAHWGYDSIKMMGSKYWWIPWLVVGALLGLSLWGMFKHRRNRWPYIVLTVLGLVALITPQGFFVADVASYGLQSLLAWVMDHLGWSTTVKGLVAPWDR